MKSEKLEEPVVAGRVDSPLVCYLVLTVLNALFWFTVDFGSFHPPSPGIFAERLYFFGIAQAGPLASFLISIRSGYVVAGVVTMVILGFLLVCARVPRSWPIGFAVCVGIVLWFFLGFCVAGIRIT
jgi:hypothetical protein